MKENSLRLHRYEPASRSNGPGLRAVVWVQGCPLACPGCFNPETHDFKGGEEWAVDALVERILKDSPRLEGLTISGGEPAHQHRALSRVIEAVRSRSNLSVLVFSGYTMEELQRFKGIDRFLAGIDVLIAGRYDQSLRVAENLIGSSNKTAHFLTNRYTQKDLDAVPQAEILLSPDGEIILSGIDPLHWQV